jgi:hypothetical protein
MEREASMMGADHDRDKHGTSATEYWESALRSAFRGCNPRQRHPCLRTQTESTLFRYGRTWQIVAGLLRKYGLPQLPFDAPTTVKIVLAMNAEGFSVATIRLALYTISKAHRVIGKLDPTKDSSVRETFYQMQRVAGNWTAWHARKLGAKTTRRKER